MALRLPALGEFNGSPLGSDERLHPPSAPGEFNGRPVVGLDATGSLSAGLGMRNPGNDLGQAASLIGNMFAQAPLRPDYQPDTPTGMYYSPSTGDMIVNGYRFNDQHADEAIHSTRYADTPREFDLPDDVGDWTPLSRGHYNDYIESIRNPGMGRRIQESWDNAWRGMGDTGAGFVLAADPHNTWAQGVRQHFAEAFQHDAPFMLQLQDIDSPGRAAEYTAQMIVQAVPWFVETVATMTAGALIGGAVSGGVGAPAGAVEALVLKSAIEGATAATLRTTMREGAEVFLRASLNAGRAATLEEATAAATTAAARQNVQRFYRFSERAFHMARGRAPGAIALSTASNYATGVGDIRNTIADAGGDASSANAMANIWGLAIPYAMLESAGDLLVTAPVTHFVPALEHAGRSRVGNAIRHGLLSAAGEGVEEVSQDVVNETARANVQGDGQHYDPLTEANTFVAGALGGLGMGAATGAMGPVNRKNTTNTNTTGGAASGTVSTPPTGGAAAPAQIGYDKSRIGLSEDGVTIINPNTGAAIPHSPIHMSPYTGLSPEDQNTIGHLSDMPPATQVAPVDTAGRYQALVQYRDQLQAYVETHPEDHAAIQTLEETNRLIETSSPDSLPVNQEAADRYRRQANPQAEPQAPLSHEDATTAVWNAVDAIEKGGQDRNVSRMLDQARTALVNANGAAAPLVARITSAMKNNNIVDDADVHALQGAIQQDIANNTIPVPMQVPAMMLGTHIADTYKEHNTKVASGEMKQLQTPVNYTVGNETTPATKRAGPVTVQPTPIGNDGLRGRTQESNTTETGVGKKHATRKERRARLDNLSEEEIRAEIAKLEAQNNHANTPNSVKKGNRALIRLLQDRLPENAGLKRVNESGTERASASIDDGADANKTVAGPPNKDTVRGRKHSLAAEAAKTTIGKLKDKSVTLRNGAKKETDNAAPKQSARTVDVGDTSGNGETLGKGNAQQKQASGESVQERSAQSEPQRKEPNKASASLKTSAEDQAYKALMSHSKHPLQAIRALYNSFGPNKSGPKVEWAQVTVNGKKRAITLEELKALQKRVEESGVDEDRKNRRRKQMQELIREAITNNNLREFLLETRRNAYDHTKRDYENLELAVDWANENERTFPKVARQVLEAAASIKDVKQNHKDNSVREFKYKKLLDAVLAVLKENDGEFPANWREQIMAKEPGMFRNRRSVTKSFQAMMDNYAPAQLAIGKRIPKSVLFARNEDEEQEQDTKNAQGGMSTNDIWNKINHITKSINPDLKFSTIHIFKDVKDFVKRLRTETLVLRDGTTTTFYDFIDSLVPVYKAKDKKLRAMSDKDVFLHIAGNYATSKGAYQGLTNSLIIFADMLTGEQDLIELLEHEWIVHRGMSAIFNKDTSRRAFLRNFGKLPGVQDALNAFLAKNPQYGSASYENQLEELFAWRAQEGPKALQELLNHPAGYNPERNRSLWSIFVDHVKKFLKMFGHDRRTADEAINSVIESLRAYALMGDVKPFLNNIMEFSGISAATSQIKSSGPDILQKSMGATAGPGASLPHIEDIFGISGGNSGRSYRARTWFQQMRGIVTGVGGDIVSSSQQILSRGVGTSVKEAWKKVGHTLETMDQLAQRSKLMEVVLQIMRDTAETARMLITARNINRPYAMKAAEFALVRSLYGDKVKGSTEEQRRAYGRLAIMATMRKLPGLTEEIVQTAPRLLIKDPMTGLYTINMPAFNALVEENTISKEDFLNGVEQFYLGAGNKLVSAGVAKATQEDIDLGYDIYVSETKELAKSALETLEHATIMLGQMNNSVVQRMLREGAFKGDDALFAEDSMRRIYALYTTIAFDGYKDKAPRARARQSEMARRWIVEIMRAYHEDEKVKDWTDKSRAIGTGKVDELAYTLREKNDTTDPYWDKLQWFVAKDAKTGLTNIERMRKIGVDRSLQFRMLGGFQAALNASRSLVHHENDVIHSIMGNYVEFTRTGNWRVFVHAINNDTNQPANLSADYTNAFMVSYAESERDAKDLQDELYNEFKGKVFTSNEEDEDGNPIKFRLEVGYERAPMYRAISDAPNIKQFTELAELLGVKLNATQMQRVANLIENAGARKRYGLQRQGRPGMDADILKNNNDLISRRAWWASKMSQAWDLDHSLADDKLVHGDWNHLKQLQDAFDIANRGAVMGEEPPPNFVRNTAAVFNAEQALTRYAWQLKHMARTSTHRSTVDFRTTKGEQKLKIEPEANMHRAAAAELQESLKKNELEVNLNDLLSKTGQLRLLAVVSQLGTVASGIMNGFATLTHLPHVLMAYNSRTGYGEGFEFSAVMHNIIKAYQDTGFDFRMTDPAYVKELLDNARNGKNSTNFTLPELEYIYAVTLKGPLMPNQSYAATGGTEGNLGSLIARNFVQFIMFPFGAVEAQNRRISAIATYRLLRERALAAGVSEAELNDINSDASKNIAAEIERVLDQTQGNYMNFNRPKFGRGDLAQYVFMYKLFGIMTTQMIYNLPAAQKLSVLGVLFLLGGLKGEPFAEDFMDLYDTLLQKMGVRHDSVELQLTRTLDQIMPGLSRWVMRGALDPLSFGGTVSSRVSMGDMLPLTGAFRDGADWGRELEDALGPAWSANKGAVEWAWVMTQGAMQMMGIGDRTMTLEQMIHKSPFAGVRAVGEAGLMAATGQITDSQGRLISDNVTPYSIFMRFLGFYPLEATKANDAVRLDRYHIGYMQAVRARYVLAWANAYRAGDTEGQQRVENYVSEWNSWARDANRTDMMINNFRDAARRAGRAASMTTVERASASAPNFSVVDELARTLDADTVSDNSQP